MKKTLVCTILIAIAFGAYAQRNSATSCGSGCYTITAKARNDKACGGNFDYTYTIKNNSFNTVDIKMFVEKRSGEWKDLGIADNVRSSSELKNSFWACDLSGRYILYYRTSGTNEKFPTEDEINARAR